MECWYPLPNKVGNVMVVATLAPPCAVPAAAPAKGTFVRRHQRGRVPTDFSLLYVR